MDRPVPILIAGPTASGKSALALRLAREFGGAVVNADSMQVYADLRVLTARPSPDETALVPHHLYGHVDGATTYSAARYAADAAAVVAELTRAGLRPIVVGGTGLYFRALTEGLSDVPSVPDEVRQRVRADAADRSAAALHADLARRDPAGAARLRPADRQRILRALEVVEATGRPLASFQEATVPGPLAGRLPVAIFLAPDRDALRTRIDARFAAMVAAGALDEVRTLAGRRLDPALPIMRAHGVPALLDHLAGRCTLAEAIGRGQADTRRYVKRQWTWFRHQMPGFAAVAPDLAFTRIAAALDGHLTRM